MKIIKKEYVKHFFRKEPGMKSDSLLYFAGQYWIFSSGQWIKANAGEIEDLLEYTIDPLICCFWITGTPYQIPARLQNYKVSGCYIDSPEQFDEFLKSIQDRLFY